MKGVILLSLLVALCVAVPTQLTYKVGQNYVYNVTGIVQNNGYDTGAGQFVPGYYSTMQAIMVMQPVSEDATSYNFVMNLFNTVVSVANTSSVSSIGDDGDSLGEDMYFTQLKNGQITLIQYYSDDPIYYVNVKVGAINAFQTSIVGVGATKVVLESDPVGNHSTSVTGSLGSDGTLFLTKEFDQADFTAFPDPTLTPHNMQISAKAVTGVHTEGYVTSSHYNQAAILVNISPEQATRARATAMTNSTGLDMQLSALGSLSVQYAPNSDLITKTFALQATNYVSASMFDISAQAGLQAQANALEIDMEAALVQLVKPTPKPTLAALSKIGQYIRTHAEALDQLIPVLQDLTSMDAEIRDRIFYVLTVAQAQELLAKYGLFSDNCEVVARAILSVPHIKTPLQIVITGMRRAATLYGCPEVHSTARHFLGAISTPVSASDFPFNKSYNAAFNVGGKVAAVDFDAKVFAGTNFNCNNPQFNFEGSATASATAILFGYSQQAFDAEIVYGQENGSPLADAITLSVWGKQVYNQPIPTINCKSATYPLAHTAPGFNIQHTLWVSIIPVVFSASANLDLSLAWGWNVCPAQLTASINLDGAGTVQLSGSSYTDLLLLRAGFQLSGSMNAALVPQVNIQGSLCQLDFEVDENNTPMAASFTSYYQWRSCKFLFIDCKWGNYNQHTWWQWAHPAGTKVLFKQTYQIHN